MLNRILNYTSEKKRGQKAIIADYLAFELKRLTLNLSAIDIEWIQTQTRSCRYFKILLFCDAIRDYLRIFNEKKVNLKAEEVIIFNTA